MCNKRTDSLSLFIKIIFIINYEQVMSLFLSHQIKMLHIMCFWRYWKEILNVCHMDWYSTLFYNEPQTHTLPLSHTKLCFSSFCISYWNLPYVLCICNVHEPEQRSQYSDSLQAGQSDDLTTLRARFSAPAQSNPGANLASCTMGYWVFFSQG